MSNPLVSVEAISYFPAIQADTWETVGALDTGQDRVFVGAFALTPEGYLLYDSDPLNIDSVGPAGFARNAAGALVVDFVNPIQTYIQGIGCRNNGAVCAVF